MNDSDNPQVAAEQARDDTTAKLLHKSRNWLSILPCQKQCAPLPRRM